MKKFSLLLVLITMVATGCNNNANVQGGYDLDEDRAGRDFVTNRPDNRVDGSRGRTMSDQNPNLLNTGGGRGNNRADIDMAREVVQQTDKFTPSTVWINGNYMWVTVYKKGTMTDREKIDAESEVHKNLTKALPRYDIEVRVLEDRS